MAVHIRDGRTMAACSCEQSVAAQWEPQWIGLQYDETNTRGFAGRPSALQRAGLQRSTASITAGARDAGAFQTETARVVWRASTRCGHVAGLELLGEDASPW